MMPLFLVITENKAFATAEKASLPFLPTMFFSTVIVRTIWTTTS